MLSIPNLLSIVRIPLALAFLQQNSAIRILAIILALISDGLDGFIARRFQKKTQFGAMLDPLMDKFFVFFLLTALFIEDKITLEQAATMLCRDLAIICFGFYLILTGNWSKFQFRSIWCGKVTTVAQLSVLAILTYGITLPYYIYTSFIVVGVLALVELYVSHYFETSSQAT